VRFAVEHAIALRDGGLPYAACAVSQPTVLSESPDYLSLFRFRNKIQVVNAADWKVGKLSRGVAAMQSHPSAVSRESGPQTRCPLAHDLNNKIAIILTHCELVSLQVAIDSKASRHLYSIRDAAKCIADMVGNHHTHEIVSQTKRS
jgi:hypothetical protein